MFNKRVLNFFAILIICIIIMVSLVILIPPNKNSLQTSNGIYTFNRVTNKEARKLFFEQFSIIVDETSETYSKTIIPKNFDSAFANYNEIQKRQGLDLSQYEGKILSCYTYKVLEVPANITNTYKGEIQVILLVYRGTVVGTDIHSIDNSFISAVIQNDNE